MAGGILGIDLGNRQVFSFVIGSSRRGLFQNKAGTERGETRPGRALLRETVVTKEFPLAHDEKNEPYYPMPFGEGMALYQRYKALAEAEPRTIFLGRLATYSYLDMWMAVAQAMVKLRAWG